MNCRETIPYADVDELIDVGVLQEANRQFFHLLGLELVAEVQVDGSHTLHFADEREQQGGIVFGRQESEWSNVRRTRAGEIERLLAARVAERQWIWGFHVQPVEDL